jgi:hypothetical protein
MPALTGDVPRSGSESAESDRDRDRDRGRGRDRDRDRLDGLDLSRRAGSSRSTGLDPGATAPQARPLWRDKRGVRPAMGPNPTYYKGAVKDVKEPM